MRFFCRKKDKSVLFFTPDYHCSFFLRDELRRRGWHAEIFVPYFHSQQLLFSDDVLRDRFHYQASFSIKNLFLLVPALLLRTLLLARYRYVIHYAPFNYGVTPTSFAHRLLLVMLKIWFLLIQISGTKLIYLPSGCFHHVSKRAWTNIDGGRVCGNCGFEPKCNDKRNNTNFEFVRRFASASLVLDGQMTTEFEETRIRYKSFDLQMYKPDLVVPRTHRWQPSKDVRVLHSHALESRQLIDKNIKGTPFVIEAVDRLRSEGVRVSLVNLSGIASREMRFHQVQADIVVDQLIYGGYGSTALEGLALGKPVICYIRPTWKQFLSSHYPEWENCPIVSATPETVYQELRKLVIDEEYRTRVGRESRRFAEKFLDVKQNVIEFEAMLLSLR